MSKLDFLNENISTITYTDQLIFKLNTIELNKKSTLIE